MQKEAYRTDKIPINEANNEVNPQQQQKKVKCAWYKKLKNYVMTRIIWKQMYGGPERY